MMASNSRPMSVAISYTSTGFSGREVAMVLAGGLTHKQASAGCTGRRTASLGGTAPAGLRPGLPSPEARCFSVVLWGRSSTSDNVIAEPYQQLDGDYEVGGDWCLTWARASVQYKYQLQQHMCVIMTLESPKICHRSQTGPISPFRFMLKHFIVHYILHTPLEHLLLNTS